MKNGDKFRIILLFAQYLVRKGDFYKTCAIAYVNNR